MAGYKQPCVHCGTYLETDARFCVGCQSASPFGDLCPTCLSPILKGQALCSNCGRPLYVTCPHCGQRTFVQSDCERCGKSLLIRCQNTRCQALQFFENVKCTACGTKIKKGER